MQHIYNTSGNAAGVLVPPLVMFPYKRLPAAICDKIPNDWSIGISENGWMKSESFYEYMTNVLYKWCLENKIKFTIIVYMDGHSSHATLSLSDFCLEHEIELISLYPNSTHITQPMDVSLFHSLKSSWKSNVTNFRLSNNGASLERRDFAPTLKVAIESLNVEEILKI